MGSPCPPFAAGARLNNYFRQRRAVLPDSPAPVWEDLAAAVLAPAGTAPGLDCEPYEVYHFGVRFVSGPLRQAVFAAELGDAELVLVLGPSVDLLFWILKPLDAVDPAGWRPVQLPTCFRRLLGSVMARTLGPQV